MSLSPLRTSKRGIKSLETLLNGEGTDENLRNNLTLIYCALPDNLSELASPPPRIVLVSFSKDGV